MTTTDRQVLEDLEFDMPGVLAWARAAEVRTVRDEEAAK